eukprot:TRINITY_DN15674_c0_g1_i1.p1 TRINITY_DN15674_c0_g1~~TRINITY_DN15674_c0_g1_i1.p1  ORF type:complete len:179 (-),score=30.17 TRINITY_DN15674_c0_g1_i1:145-681(-)
MALRAFFPMISYLPHSLSLYTYAIYTVYACKVKDTVMVLIASCQQRHTEFESSTVRAADVITTLSDAACAQLVDSLNNKRNDINNGIIKYADIDRDICEIQAHVVALVSYTNSVIQSDAKRASPTAGDARASKPRRRSLEKHHRDKTKNKSGGAAVAVPASSVCPRKKRHGFVYSTDL